jgi:acyl dehydratase
VVSQTHQASRNQVAIEALEGRNYGPVRLQVCREKVVEFISATGDDPERWIEFAPPGWAASALFAVAPLLLGDQEVASSSVIHGEQRFSWLRPIPVESDLEVLGTVTRARERGGVWFLNFDLTVTDSEGDLVNGSSTFLASGASAPGGAVEEATDVGPQEKEAGELSASRSDLVRYAAATRDWNPIHWDHGSAVSAGLPGIVVHGLLQSAWMLRSITAEVDGPAPITSARFRYRAPLLVGQAASVRKEVEHEEVNAVLECRGTELVTATIRLR